MSYKLEKLMQENNQLLREQAGHFIAMRAALETIMVYLPACATQQFVDRDAVKRITHAYAATQFGLRPWKPFRKRPKRRTY
jgi:hypothetical protein